MFKVLALAAIVVIVQPLLSGADILSTNKLNVMSFNVRTTLANDPCPQGCWNDRKDRIHQMLDIYKPDLIGTQESAPDQVAFFNYDLHYGIIGECAGDCQWNERDAIFYNTSRLQLLKNATYALSDTPDTIPSNTWELQYLRAAVLGRFQDKISNRTVCMLNTHYDITLGQPQSSKLVARLMNEFCHVDDAVFMTGDLNTTPDTPAVLYLTGDWLIDNQTTPIPLYEALTRAGAGGPTWIGGSFGSQVLDKKIDYIFSRLDGFTCLQNGTVITDTFVTLNTTGAFSVSDHAVVQSTFCLGASCSNCIA